MSRFKVVCIDASKMPMGFPPGCWIEKGKPYTVIGVFNMMNQAGKIGYALEEIQFPKGSMYQMFLSERFLPIDGIEEQEAEKAVAELLEELKEELIFS
jgi:hypothetical protein